ncbi:MAG: cupin domain-containing protein [Acidimicrobiaceae bacterium]
MNSTQLVSTQEVAEVVVPCLDLDETLSFFLTNLGFRVEMITPADNPNTAVISGYGVRLCLRSGGSGKGITVRLNSDNRATQTLHAPNGTTIEIITASTDVVLPELKEALVVTPLTSDASWTVGRAGMHYRDLIPSRLGGAFIASHIHIPKGGPVPDYVHYHRIKFQMIYCKSGWVRVVYEDQGESFVMNAGDCVLQPPEIRHRVLESSDNLEVIEIGAPAEHETFAEHTITLPTSTVQPDRDFSGQRFVRHIADQTPWLPWHVSGFEARNTGIDLATSGYANAMTIRAKKSAVFAKSEHQNQLMFMFVLSGSATLETGSDHETKQLQIGTSVTLPSTLNFKLGATADDTQFLLVEVGSSK